MDKGVTVGAPETIDADGFSDEEGGHGSGIGALSADGDGGEGTSTDDVVLGIFNSAISEIVDKDDEEATGRADDIMLRKGTCMADSADLAEDVMANSTDHEVSKM